MFFKATLPPPSADNTYMSSRRTEWSLKLGEAMIAFSNGDKKEALEKAQAAAQETQSSEVKALADYISLRIQDGDKFDGILKNQSCPEDEVFIAVYRDPSDGNVYGYDYDCEALKRGVSRFGKLAAKEFKHKTDNFRLDIIQTKFDKSLKTKMQFTPDLFHGSHYIRQHVLDHYNADHNEWVSTPSGFQSYSDNLQETTHHYRGIMEPQDRAKIYYGKDALFILPVPDGFVLDAKSVRLNDSYEGFDLVRDKNGIIYLRLNGDEGIVFTNRTEVEFDLKEEPGILVSDAAEAVGDILPGVSLPPLVASLQNQTQVYGAQEKYEAIHNFISKEFQYPEMKDILNGHADYPEANGKEFYGGLSEMHLADCDVANGYGVVLLRKLGVPARLVVGFYLDERGIGRHGWLEYWDDHLGHWVRGDVTPPMTEKKSKEKQIFPIKITPLEFLEAKDRSVTPFVESYRVFLGESENRTSVLSRPSGRYLVGQSSDEKTVSVYDLEYDRMSSVPFDQSKCAAVVNSVQETLDGFSIDLECTNIIPQEGNDNIANKHGMQFPSPANSYCPDPIHKVIDQDGKQLYWASGTNFLTLSRPPYVLHTKVNAGDAKNWRASYKETEGGILVATTVFDQKGTIRLYKTKIEWSEIKNGSYLLDLTRLENPLMEFPAQDDKLVGVTHKFSPDGSHFIVHGSNGQRFWGSVFKGDKKIYSLGIETPLLHNISLANDGSLDFKSIESQRAALRHINPDGEEDISKRRSWSWDVKEGGRVDVDLLLGSEEDGLHITQPIRSSLFMELQDISNVAIVAEILDQDHLVLSDGKASLPVYLKDGKNLVQGELHNAQSCFAKEGAIRCFEPSYPETHNAEGRSVYIGGDKAMQAGRYFAGGDFDIEQEKRNKFAAWQVKHYSANNNNGDAFPNESAVLSFRNPFELALRDAILRGDLENTELFFWSAMGDPKADIFSDWILLGSASLFNDDEECADSSARFDCSEKMSRQLQNIRWHGGELVDHLLPKLEETAHFKNTVVAAKGWAYVLAAAVLSKSSDDAKNLFKKMVALNPDQAAEAVVDLMESALVTPEKIPQLEFVDEDILTDALRAILTRKKEVVIASMHQKSSIGMDIQMQTASYRSLEGLLQQRFGGAVLPATLRNDY